MGTTSSTILSVTALARLSMFSSRREIDSGEISPRSTKETGLIDTNSGEDSRSSISPLTLAQTGSASLLQREAEPTSSSPLCQKPWTSPSPEERQQLPKRRDHT